jgi:hypothetical protein
MELIMKIFISTLAVAALLAVPASARVTRAESFDQQVTQLPANHPALMSRAEVAEQPIIPNASPFQHRPEWDVYVNGQYAGSDPDPRIRESLRQDFLDQESGD